MIRIYLTSDAMVNLNRTGFYGFQVDATFPNTYSADFNRKALDRFIKQNHGVYLYNDQLLDTEFSGTWGHIKTLD